MIARPHTANRTCLELRRLDAVGRLRLVQLRDQLCQLEGEEEAARVALAVDGRQRRLPEIDVCVQDVLTLPLRLAGVGCLESLEVVQPWYFSWHPQFLTPSKQHSCQNK